MKANEFVLCISNKGFEASLVVGKVYRRLQDPAAEAHNLIRIVDEDTSEPDGYLYPTALFVPIEPPEKAKKALKSA